MIEFIFSYSQKTENSAQLICVLKEIEETTALHISFENPEYMTDENQAPRIGANNKVWENQENKNLQVFSSNNPI